ncbi:dihydroorotase [Flavobacterium sp.]|uniref:dihydroorotase n=1 Tax=Flavobacterium sp. TaxID=239 RepID=UPI004033C600
MDIIIKDACIINEGSRKVADLYIRKGRIEAIGEGISQRHKVREIAAPGMYLLPGLIDGHVHFREPGFPEKGTIYSESRAAVAGGITSFMDMPNTNPATLTTALLEEKYKRAAESSFCNYSFFMGVCKDNLDQALRVDSQRVCGISDDGLYFGMKDGILAGDPEFVDRLFSRAETLVALHSEDDWVIRRNTEQYLRLYGKQIPIACHPLIRSREACLKATEMLVATATRHSTRLHLLHISTADEAALFPNTIPLRQKRITAEACTHHLYFNDADYGTLGARIKWNPAIKSENDRKALLAAVADRRIDTLATDHAPHSLREKSGDYFEALSGGPLVQHSLAALLELAGRGEITLEDIVTATSHNVAESYRIVDRGYIREGYFADLVLVKPDSPWLIQKSNIHYQCGWSPFEGTTFRNRVQYTLVNGRAMFDNGKFCLPPQGERLIFEKYR